MPKKKTTKRSAQASSAGFLHHFNILAGLFFALSFAVIMTLSGYTSMAAKPQPALAVPNLTLSPASATVSSGSTLSVQIWEDSGTQNVNAVQANLTYPADKLSFVNVDSTNTGFGVDAQSSGGNGTVTIAKGSTTPVQGKFLVATVNFTSLSSSANKHKSTATISFAPGTALLSSTTNSDILAATYGGNYTLQN